MQQWQNEVARPLEGCSNVALAVGVALAAPLFRFADEQTGGFHSYGPSTIGKSLAGAMGKSVYGAPSATVPPGINSFGKSWKAASEVSIEAFARMRNDVGVFLDELGKALDVKKQIVPLVYTLSSGQPALRADSQGRLRAQSGFAALVFSTGEPSVREFLAGTGDTEGRAKRFVDVPALVGVMTALEKFTHVQIGEAGPRLYALLARLHGAVGQAWLRYLVDLGEAGIKAKLDQHRREWLAQPEIAELIAHDPKDELGASAVRAAGGRVAHGGRGRAVALGCQKALTVRSSPVRFVG